MGISAERRSCLIDANGCRARVRPALPSNAKPESAIRASPDYARVGKYGTSPRQRSHGFFVFFPRTLPSQNISPPLRCSQPSGPQTAFRTSQAVDTVGVLTTPLRSGSLHGRMQKTGDSTTSPAVHPSIHPSSAEIASSADAMAMHRPPEHPVSDGRDGTFRPPVVCSVQHTDVRTQRAGDASLRGRVRVDGGRAAGGEPHLGQDAQKRERRPSEPLSGSARAGWPGPAPSVTTRIERRGGCRCRLSGGVDRSFSSLSSSSIPAKAARGQPPAESAACPCRRGRVTDRVRAPPAAFRPMSE